MEKELSNEQRLIVNKYNKIIVAFTISSCFMVILMSIITILLVLNKDRCLLFIAPISMIVGVTSIAIMIIYEIKLENFLKKIKDSN
jgi:hypothetical protein